MKAPRWVVFVNPRKEIVINFDLNNDRLYYDWFIKIRDKRFVIERNKDTVGGDYEACSCRE